MYQQLTLIGNLGTEPEMRYTPSGTPVATFTLAVNRAWTTQDGARQEKTTWFRVTCWRKLAETVTAHLHKGRQVLVVGEVEEAHAWLDSEGKPRATLEVTAQTVRFLGGKPVASATANGDGDEPGAKDELPF